MNLYRHRLEKDWSHINDTEPDTNDTNPDTNDTIPEIDTKILQLIQENPAMTQAELKEKLKISLASVKRLMSDLQKRGIIERQGSNRVHTTKKEAREPAVSRPPVFFFGLYKILPRYRKGRLSISSTSSPPSAISAWVRNGRSSPLPLSTALRT